MLFKTLCGAKGISRLWITPVLLWHSSVSSAAVRWIWKGRFDGSLEETGLVLEKLGPLSSKVRSIIRCQLLLKHLLMLPKRESSG